MRPIAPDGGRDFPLLLAPMAGVTNTVFRKICKEWGADVLTSEFVSAEGILHRNERTRRYVEFDPAERPFGIQLFGAEPERLAEAARALADWVQPDFVDINFGCPVNKVVCKNGGSSLLRDGPLLEKVARAIVGAVPKLPVTAKIRIGWDERSINAVETARRLEGVGVARLAVHGRTRAQGYSGGANWELISEVAAAVGIPVIGNGDIRSGADACKRRAQSGIAGLMIGRAAMNAPWVFSEIRAALEGQPFTPPSPLERWHLILRHCQEEIAWRGAELPAMRAMRARLMAYTRGMPGGARLRGRLARVESLRAVQEVAEEALRLAELGDAASPLGHDSLGDSSSEILADSCPLDEAVVAGV